MDHSRDVIGRKIKREGEVMRAQDEDAEVDRYNAAYQKWVAEGRIGRGPCRPGDEVSELYAQIAEAGGTNAFLRGGYVGRHRG